MCLLCEKDRKNILQKVRKKSAHFFKIFFENKPPICPRAEHDPAMIHILVGHQNPGFFDRIRGLGQE